MLNTCGPSPPQSAGRALLDRLPAASPVAAHHRKVELALRDNLGVSRRDNQPDEALATHDRDRNHVPAAGAENLISIDARLSSRLTRHSLDPDDELAALLQGYDEPDVEGFWQDVATNLAARRLRLLFVADEIPDPLARVVTFLNAQMLGIEVLAVEIKRFRGGSDQALVPRVIGRTAAGSGRGQGRSAPKLTHQSFLEGFANEEVRGVVERLLEATEQSGGYVYYGTGGVSIRVNCSIRRQHVSVAWLYPRPAIGWMRTRDFSFGAAIFEDDLPEELRAVLEPWIDQFAEDDFTEDVSSKGTRVWAVSHEAAVQQQELLVDRLRGMVSELAAL